MQPYFALTYTRALERVGGTALGGLAAAASALVCTTPLAIAAAMFPLAVVAFAVRAVSLGLFMATLTPLVVLLVETSVPGTSEWSIAWARFALTTAGGVIAVAAGFLLWPTWEPERLGQEARAAIGAHGAYAEAVLAAIAREEPATTVEAARRGAGVASNSLEASISRALTEPGSTGRDRLEAALVIDAALRRVAGPAVGNAARSRLAYGIAAAGSGRVARLDRRHVPRAGGGGDGPAATAGHGGGGFPGTHRPAGRAHGGRDSAAGRVGPTGLASPCLPVGASKRHRARGTAYLKRSTSLFF